MNFMDDIRELQKRAENFENTGIQEESIQNNSDNSDEIDWENASTYSTASGCDLPYVVIQVTLKEKFIGTGSGNLSELEAVINYQAAKGYRLHTIATSNGGSKGLAGGDRIQATMVFEKLGLFDGMQKKEYKEKAYKHPNTLPVEEEKKEYTEPLICADEIDGDETLPDTIVCPVCGKIQEAGNNVCQNCGAKFTKWSKSHRGR